MKFRAHIATAALVCALTVTAAASALAASLEDAFARSDETSDARLDHSAWDALLERYRVLSDDGVSLFAYGRVGAADRALLDTYIESLEATEVTALARPAQLAYWINLYNAVTVRVVLDGYPVESIRDITSGLFSFGPWGEERVTVEGHALSLDDIEHEILRPIWRDPRIHYVVSCASIGCPNLAAVAFTRDNAETLMEEGARAYVNHPRGVRLDDGTLVASSIYDWYAGDFGTEAELMEHLRRYAEPGLAAQLAGRTHIGRYTYDWALNDAP